MTNIRVEMDVINEIYNDLDDGYCIPKKEELLMRPSQHEYHLDGFGSQIYGEITLEGVSTLIDYIGLTNDDVFIDLGSGIGKVVVQVALQTGCRAIGIEFSQTRHDVAEHAHRLLAEKHPSVVDRILFVQGDIADDQYLNSDITCVFFNNICFSSIQSTKVMRQFTKLSPGTKIVTTSPLCYRHGKRCMKQNMPCCLIDLVDESFIPCSWSSKCPIYVYVIK